MAISYTAPWIKVKDERRRQDEKFPADRNLEPRVWLNILVEEVGEVAKDIMDKKPDTMEKEIVQVAAVAIGWLEDIQRQREQPRIKHRYEDSRVYNDV